MGAVHLEQKSRTTYYSHLHLEQLLELQRTLTDSDEELLFVVSHQIAELWLKVVLAFLEKARASMSHGDAAAARVCLDRVLLVQRMVRKQFDVLETIPPRDFLTFRSALGSASALESCQFHEIDALCGHRDPLVLDLLRHRLADNPKAVAAVERRFAEPTLWDAFLELLHRAGALPDLTAEASIVRKVVVQLATQPGGHSDLVEVAERLLAYDAATAKWRAHHALVAERFLGADHGTGGTSGAAWLVGRLGIRYFPLLWQARTDLADCFVPQPASPGASGVPDAEAGLRERAAHCALQLCHMSKSVDFWDHALEDAP